MKKLVTLSIVLSMLLAVSIGAAPKSLEELQTAFAYDNHDIVKTVEYQGKKGILALHRTAINHETKQRKKVYYVEGNPYQMGYLLGMLAHDDVEKMTTIFLDNIIFSFIKADVDPKKIPIIWGIMKGILTEGAKEIRPDVPAQYIEEMSGLVAGCLKSNSKSKVTFDDILLLNVGFDALLSRFYALNKVGFEEMGLDPQDIELPVMCNAFSAFGNATVDGKHYFGRDFMFPPAKVFQDVACMTIYNPEGDRVPLVAVNAPGMVGSITTMNIEGVGMGLDMVPGNNSNPKRPGLNSLLMVRHASHNGTSATKVVDTIAEAQRGVTWLYFVADGKNNRAAAIESGMKTDDLAPLKNALPELKDLGLIPNADFLKRYETQKHKKGIMVRWNDYKYPETFMDFNKDLFTYHEKEQTSKSWGSKGFINRNWKDKNCPAAYYFAPQREDKDDAIVMTNHYVIPSMRVSAMNYWTMMIAGKKQDDIQWRYDELNSQVLFNYGQIDEAKAIEIADYLSPRRKHPDYYKNNKKSSDGKTSVIRGSVSLCNLTDLVIHSSYGYYHDQWVTLHLKNYINK